MYSSKLSLLVSFHVPTNCSTILLKEVNFERYSPYNVPGFRVLLHSATPEFKEASTCSKRYKPINSIKRGFKDFIGSDNEEEETWEMF